MGYYALVDFTQAIPRPDLISDSCDWFELDKLLPLILDHRDIADKTLETLRIHLDSKLIGFN